MRGLLIGLLLVALLAVTARSQTPDPPPVKVKSMQLKTYDEVIAAVERGARVQMFIGLWAHPYYKGNGYIHWAELPTGTKGIPDGEYSCESIYGVPKMSLVVRPPIQTMPRFAPTAIPHMGIPVQQVPQAQSYQRLFNPGAIRIGGVCVGPNCPR